MRQGYFRLNRQMSWMVTGAMILSLLCLVRVSQAEEVAAEEETVEVKQVQGEVSSLSAGNNPRYIGITYKQDEQSATDYEMALYIDKDVNLVHKSNLSQIGIGDTVDVTYHEITTTTEAGRERVKRVAKRIRFIKAADKTMRQKYWLLTDEEKEQEKKAIKQENERGLLLSR